MKESLCPVCSSPVDAGDRFCGNCGASLTGVSPTLPPPKNTAASNTQQAAECLDRANSLVSQGALDQAIDALTQAIKLDPNFAPAYTNRAMVRLLIEGSEQAALEDCNQAIRLNEKDALAYANRGLARCRLGNDRQALQDCNQAIQLMPDLADAYFHRGLTHAEIGALDRAITDFDKALQLEPDNSDAYDRRGQVFVSLGELKRAVKDFDRAVSLRPDNPSYYRDRADAFRQLGKLKRALKDFDQALRLDPHDPVTYNDRGLVYMDLEKTKQAVEDYSHAIQLAEQSSQYQSVHVMALVNRAVLEAEAGNSQAAKDDCNRALQIDPQDAQAHYIRGIVYQDTGDDESAIADFRQVLQSPSASHLHEDAASRLRQLTN